MIIEATKTKLPEIKQPQDVSLWSGDDTSIDDISYPRLILISGKSQLVDQGKATPNTIIESEGYNVLCGKDSFVEILPLTTYIDWTKNQKLPAEKEFKQICSMKIPAVMPPKGKWTTDVVIEDGMDTVYKKRINAFVLVFNPKAENVLPYKICFKGFGANAGKAISSHFQISAMTNTSPIRKVFNLSIGSVTMDGRTTICWDVKKGRATTEEEVALATTWRQRFKEAGEKLMVDKEVDVESEEAPF